ncbi:MAG: amidohydrolase family protein [Dehalococcoidia bacterium]
MIVITGGTLVDGTGAPPLADAVVVIEGDRIESTGTARDTPIPAGPGVTLLPVQGKTIMPGIIDAHDHLSSHGYGLADRLGLSKPLSLIHLETAAILADTLACGTTTVRDAGGLDLGFKLAIDRGLIPGPRTCIALSFISPTGGIGDGTTISGLSIPPRPGLPSGVANGAEAVREKVREMVRAGADVIKTATTGGVSSARRGPLDAEFSRAELEAMVDEARLLGKKVMCHALGGPGLRTAVEAGVHSIEHGGYLDLDPEVVQMMADKGIFYVPTFMVYVYHAGERAGAPYMQERAHAMKQHHIRSLQMALESGVRVAMGTDAGGYEHGQNPMELQLMVEAGMTPMQAIVASTQTAAECLDLRRYLGTLEPGKLADLLVVDGDPLADIRMLQDRSRVELIMQGGEVVGGTQHSILSTQHR